MRSQAPKPLPKKGDSNKTPLKNSITKLSPKKTVSSKKVKHLVSKSLVKGPKKNNTKDDNVSSKNGDSLNSKDKNETIDVSEINKPGSSKSPLSRSISPSRKSKKDGKEKKDTVKNMLDSNTKKIVSKKLDKKTKVIKPKIVKKSGKDNNDAKYKINKIVKKTTPKFSKAKKIIKKTSIASSDKKKDASLCNQNRSSPEKESEEGDTSNQGNSSTSEDSRPLVQAKNETALEENTKSEMKNSMEPTKIIHKTATSNQSETPKNETERPPKFFTSTRSPRTVDIDVKCCKTSKGNLSVSERFLSMKLELNTKSEENNAKNLTNTLISQGPDIDVYTFTEKVDSPKSILSDFRRPINKNIGRVRPIARVKGTVIDKKTESEKKKYSPHRPIEEVVKQLKANKRSEEIIQTQPSGTETNIEFNIDKDVKDPEDKPKPIVSKSYKMVARKSSITGKPFSPIKFDEQDVSIKKEDKSNKSILPDSTMKKTTTKTKKQSRKQSLSDDEFADSKFSLNTKSLNYSSSEESVSESNDDNDSKESSESDSPKNRKTKNKKYKRITDGAKKTSSKELKELSKDSLIDLKDNSGLPAKEKPSKRRLKLLSMWSGPKKHRMASLNAIAKVHCLYENESRTHMELGLMKTVDRQVMPGTSKSSPTKKKETKPKEVEKHETTSESEYESKKDKKDESSESSDDSPPQRTLRGVPGIRSAGKYWDPKSSTSSSEESELETKKKPTSAEKKKTIPKGASNKSDSDKPPAKMKKTAGVPVKKKRNRNEVIMDLKDMVVQKRMASLNATAILAASYEKRSPKSNKDDTTSDSCSDESFSQKTKNGASSGVKSETKIEETKKEIHDTDITDKKQKVEVIVNQDTDVTITGVYSTHHHEGFCTVSGMQYRISSTSHTQTTATANCEKEGCSREDGARYTPLSALSSMQPPAEHAHTHPHPVADIGGLTRRAGCSSAFSAPSSASQHEPGYYQPAGPLIKETSADAERALARYHPPPHYHAPHPPVQYGAPYFPDCYNRFYRFPGSYHMPPPQPDAPMVGVGGEPYPPPQYYSAPPCYQHSPQRIPYVEYRGCSCSLNPCPKNVLIGPATGKAPTGGGPADVPSALALPGGAFPGKVRACALDAVADTHGSGKDPPLRPEPPAAADAHHPCPLPAIGGVSPKRELYDVRENLRIAGDTPGPAEALGPPSPARGSAGACAPQPPPSAPRRARLGKDMARRSLAGDDTGLLLSTPQRQSAISHHSDADDDVLAISPPLSAPIDLSSSDERSTPLVDVKKENEGPTYATPRKPDAQALREHNSTTMLDTSIVTDAAKPAKRRYSKPKLEIDMKDTQLEDGCKTNGIGEHVKLQKRRKVSGDHSDIPRTETITKESKKKPTQKRTPKTPSREEKKIPIKRKQDSPNDGPKPKKIFLETTAETKPKNKSALLLDNLIRKNSIDRADSKNYSSDAELNPAELFLPPNENVALITAKKSLTINNNIVESATPGNSVRANTIAAVSQLIEKKLASKNACKVEKVDSKVTHGIKSVLKTPTVKSNPKESKALHRTNSIDSKTCKDVSAVKESTVSQAVKEKMTVSKDSKNCTSTSADIVTNPSTVTATKPLVEAQALVEESQTATDKPEIVVDSGLSKIHGKDPAEEIKSDKSSIQRSKLANGEMKAKNVEKVVKLLVSKRPAIKTDEATLVIEEACASPSPSVGSSMRRHHRSRRGFGLRRGRRPLIPPEPPALDPHATPRWSNGWHWDSEHYVSKVYLNNDSRYDRSARCWSRMTHASGDSVARGDCVLLRASAARAQPYVARVASLWENPEDGEMMVSLVWYYRPEHTERGRQPADALDEVFASRHRDANSVACIEDKCYVLTFNEYCRYRKRLKAAEEGITIAPSIVPPMPPSEVSPAVAPNDSKLPPSVSPELVLFCRKIYDFRSKKIHVPNK